jgi:hypothetical protein
MPRAEVPNVISSNSSTIDTSAFGTPTANWPRIGCDMTTFFSPQNIVLDITLCGGACSLTPLFSLSLNWWALARKTNLARPPNVFSQTCPGVCYDDWVLGPAANYTTAYFEIASLRVFSASGTNTVIDPNAPKPNMACRLLITSSAALSYVVTLFGVGLSGWFFGM